MTARRRLQGAVLVLAPAFLFLALHLPALDYAFVWTDAGEIEAGSIVRPPRGIPAAFAEPLHGSLDFRLSGAPQSYYRPLQVATVSALHAVVGKDPRAYRAVSLLLGAATVALFTALAAFLLRGAGPGLLAGAIVAAHPATIEAYVWIAAMSAALADLFIVAAVGAAAMAWCAGRRGTRVACGALAIFAFALGLFSKESAVVVPALTAALAVVLGLAGRGPPPRILWARSATLVTIQAALAASYLLLWRPYVLGGAITAAPLIGGTIASHVASAVSGWPRAFAWLFAPVHSTTGSVVAVVDSLATPAVWLGLALPLASVVGVWVLARRGAVASAFGLAWIWIAYLPTSNLVPLTHPWSERDLLLSVFGAALVTASVVAGMARRAAPRRSALALGLVGAAVVALLGWRTTVRLPAWQNTLRLFETDLAREPLHREAHFLIAFERWRAGHAEEARAQLDALFSLRDEFANRASYLRESDAHELYCRINLDLERNADTLRLHHDRYGATAGLRAAPGFHFCRARALVDLGRPDAAIAVYDELDRLTTGETEPAFIVAIARAHAVAGRPDDARAWLARIPRQSVQDRALENEIVEVNRILRRPSARTRGRSR